MLRGVLALVVLVSVLSRHDAPVVVSAAISLSGPLEEIAKAYAAQGGGEVRFNFAASNVLARQIANGAPADLFISADEAQMDYAQAQNAIDTATRSRLLSNRLAVVGPLGRQRNLRDTAGLLDPGIRRIAIGDPAAVPAGVYAKQYLERLGLWQTLQPKLLPLANVRAALGAVESASVDAAFVYESDAAVSSRVQIAFVIDGANAPRIVYPAALTLRSKNRAAATKFLDFLHSPTATTIFARYKFSRPS